MSILEKLNAVKDTIPHYWPIGAFIHHNPLKGFEHLNFKEALTKAQGIFGGQVYMDSEYYTDLYTQGKISDEALEKNLEKCLTEHKLEAYKSEAKTFMLELSQAWKGLKSYEALKINEIDDELHAHLKEKSIYFDKQAWIKELTTQMTFYEIHDALFDTSERELIRKDIIEFLARFLDQEQTTLSMSNRNLGMFETFKLYEEIEHDGDAQSYVEMILKKLKVKDVEKYFLTHILKLHGWAGFIKYRSEDPNYYMQKKHPSTLMEYMAVRLHFERKYTGMEVFNNFNILEVYIEDNEVVIIANLEPRKIRGEISEGMVIAATKRSGEDAEDVAVLRCDRPMPSGSKVS